MTVATASAPAPASPRRGESKVEGALGDLRGQTTDIARYLFLRHLQQ